jgi:hypothetical protein
MTTLLRSMKLVVLFAGLLGVGAYLLPFFVFELGPRNVEVSAHEILTGFDDPTLDPLRYEQTGGCTQNVMSFDNGSVLSGYVCEETTKHLSYVPIYFASAVIFVLLGLWAIIRRRMSGLAGLLTLPGSFLAIGGWLREMKLDRLSDTSHTAIGASLLGLSGILALLATVVLLVRQEPRRPVKKKPVVKATLPEARIVR